jgi:hypothetical protein
MHPSSREWNAEFPLKVHDEINQIGNTYHISAVIVDAAGDDLGLPRWSKGFTPTYCDFPNDPEYKIHRRFAEEYVDAINAAYDRGAADQHRTSQDPTV